MAARVQEPSISLANVEVDFNGARALSIPALQLGQQSIAVIGANGSGKSSFARLLNGLLKPNSGSVLVNGVDVVADSRAAVRQAGFIFANPDLQIVMPTVIEDVEFSLRESALSKSARRAKAVEALERVGLASLSQQPAQTLSSGQKQLLAIAAITVNQPALIIADEPTALLDAGNTKLIAQLLFAPVAPQLVLVTHDMALAAKCDVAVWFEGGKIAEVGSAAAVIASYVGFIE